MLPALYFSIWLFNSALAYVLTQMKLSIPSLAYFLMKWAVIVLVVYSTFLGPLERKVLRTIHPSEEA